MKLPISDSRKISMLTLVERPAVVSGVASGFLELLQLARPGDVPTANDRAESGERHRPQPECQGHDPLLELEDSEVGRAEGVP